jgi:hypothetical protein
LNAGSPPFSWRRTESSWRHRLCWVRFSWADSNTPHPVRGVSAHGAGCANLFVFSPLFVIGGLLLWLGKKAGDYILALAPIFLIYYGLSVGIGIEWSRPEYSGNSEQAFGLFLTLIISGVLFIPVVMGLFSHRTMRPFSGKTRPIYLSAFLLFIMLFAGMWISEVRSVLISQHIPGL